MAAPLKHMKPNSVSYSRTDEMKYIKHWQQARGTKGAKSKSPRQHTRRSAALPPPPFSASNRLELSICQCTHFLFNPPQFFSPFPSFLLPPGTFRSLKSRFDRPEDEMLAPGTFEPPKLNSGRKTNIGAGGDRISKDLLKVANNSVFLDPAYLQ